MLMLIIKQFPIIMFTKGVFPRGESVQPEIWDSAIAQAELLRYQRLQKERSSWKGERLCKDAGLPESGMICYHPWVNDT